jgi:polysaccharide chain length determinant protein (PEP-CTERM system associated)
MQATLPQQQLSVARRSLDLEDYLQILRRNVAWMLGPALAGLTVAVVIAFFWPDTYESMASIRVVPPQVPERLVPTNVNMQMAERVNSMTQTILSRNTLTNIIQTYDLYRKEKSKMPMEDVIEMMRSNVKIGNLTEVNHGRNAAFKVEFAYENRYTAQKVTRDLMTRFIDENIRERHQQAQQTTQFLREQFDQARAEVDAIEQRLTQYKSANAGRLPEQLGGHLSLAGVLEARMSGLTSSISRANQERTILEAELRAMRDRMNKISQMPSEVAPAAGGGSSAGAPGEDDNLTRLEREVQQLERTLALMLEQYKPEYPDVQRVQARLQTVKKERDTVLNRKLAVRDQPASSAPVPVAARPNPARMREIADMEQAIARVQAQIKAKEMEVDRYVRDQGDANRRLQDVEARMSLVPVGQQQMEMLTRDYETAKRRYDELRRSVTQSEMASELESRKQSETLEVLDLPSLPETPTAPTRPLIIGGGLILGFIFGAALAAVRELRDTSLKSLKDIRAYTQFNVLGSVPLLENDLVVRRRKRIGMLAWTTACILSVLVMGGSIYYYNATKM